MPFGSIFGAIVFGVFGPLIGTRMLSAPSVPIRVMGGCLAVLGVTVAAGLLMRRSWARWLGALVGVVFAAFVVFSPDDVVHLTVMLGSLAAAALLIVPATGRPRVESPAPVAKPSAVSRAFLGIALVSLLGLAGAAPFAFTKAPGPPDAAPAESRQGEARPAEPRSGTADGRTSAPPPAPSGPVTWHDFADGLKAAKSDRKLVVADFYATWCGPCKMMEKRTFKDPRVMRRLRDVVPVRVDSEEETPRGGLRGLDLAERYGIEMYPTIVVLDATGHEVARNTGAMGPDEFLEWIDGVIEKAGTALARS